MSLKPLSGFLPPNKKASGQNTESQRDLASELLAGNFNKTGVTVDQLSDPLVDTPMIVTLDELKPYEHNPRLIKNPIYEEIKASIRERGLDAPPAITRRPGEPHFIIRNGGNTRLSVLKELWAETRDERFFKIHCLFRPWQSEIVVLTGHLAENELHGALIFIERALAVEKVREIYQQEATQKVTQQYLADKLAKNGYPISQTVISQMQETISYLLPVIPGLLYGGMSRSKVRELLRLRKSALITWDKQLELSGKLPVQAFDDVFTEVLSIFDDPSRDFDLVGFQDQLTSYIAQVFDCSYDLIALDLNEKSSRQKMIESPPAPTLEINEEEFLSKPKTEQLYDIEAMEEKEILAIPIPKTKSEPPIRVTRTDTTASDFDQASLDPTSTNNISDEEPQSVDQQEVIQKYIDEHIVSPVDTTSRLSAIQDMVSGLTGDSEPNFKTNVLKSIPVQAGGLFAVSDIWHIGSSLNNFEQLRVHIGQLVIEIAEDTDCGLSVETIDSGLGFTCRSLPTTHWTGQILLQFLQALAGQPSSDTLLHSLSSLITGSQSIPEVNRLSDVAFVKLMRVFRLMRRYYELSNFSQENNNHLL